jgi:hypothetical protein
MSTGTQRNSKRASSANSTNAKTMLHFMLIRDEIGMLPRPQLVSLESGSVDMRSTKKSKQKKRRPASMKVSQQDLEHVQAAVDLLISRLEAYEAVIEKVDRIAHHGLTIFDNVNVGGRRPDVVTAKMAQEIAIDYRRQKGKFPSARALHDLVCERLFKADPQGYIDSIKHRMKPEEVAQNRSDPAWWYWKKCPRPYSERLMHNILVDLRQEEKTSA